MLFGVGSVAPNAIAIGNSDSGEHLRTAGAERRRVEHDEAFRMGACERAVRPQATADSTAIRGTTDRNIGSAVEKLGRYVRSRA